MEIQVVHFEEIRHSFLSMVLPLIAAQERLNFNSCVLGGDMKEFQLILGHDNVYDTKRLYGEALENRIVKNVTLDPLYWPKALIKEDPHHLSHRCIIIILKFHVDFWNFHYIKISQRITFRIVWKFCFNPFIFFESFF